MGAGESHYADVSILDPGISRRIYPRVLLLIYCAHVSKVPYCKRRNSNGATAQGDQVQVMVLCETR